MQKRELIKKVIRLRVEGKAYRTIAEELGIPIETVIEILQQYQDAVMKVNGAEIRGLLALHDELMADQSRIHYKILQKVCEVLDSSELRIESVVRYLKQIETEQAPNQQNGENL